MENVIIIGTGPAGLTAAIYAGRAQLSPLVITGKDVGGQITLTSDIENYPGFPEGINGFELATRFQQQAERFGARTERAVITGVDFQHQPLTVKTDSGTLQANAVIIATGSSPRRLGVPGEDRLLSRGVSYCATCDGFFFKNKKIAVVGGGDSALDEGLFLTKFGREVVIIHRRDRLRANSLLQRRAHENTKMSFMLETIVTEVIGGQHVEALRVKNVKTEKEETVTFDGVFVFIGHIPNTQAFQGQLDLDDNGYLIVDRHSRTNIPGIFGAGDVHDHVYRQAITASASGAIAAIEAEKYLAELEGKAYT
ncbi:thioredoxin-disulfide reductase [bacterium]|nr:thioredoxin-disulfide reductase [bacterium]